MENVQTKFSLYLEKLASLKAINDFYEYEKAFSQILNEFGREMLEESIKHQPKGSDEKVYKKKSRPNLGM